MSGQNKLGMKLSVYLLIFEDIYGVKSAHLCDIGVCIQSGYRLAPVACPTSGEPRLCAFES